MKRWQRRLFGILALGGGATGIAIAGQHLMLQNRWLPALLVLLAIAIYSWGIWCGLTLLEGRPDSLKYNRRYWLVQSPILLSSLIGGRIWGGLHASIQFSVWPVDFQWSAALGAGFNYTLLGADQPLTLGVNLFALALATWLARIDAQSTVLATPAVARQDAETPHTEPPSTDDGRGAG